MSQGLFDDIPTIEAKPDAQAPAAFDLFADIKPLATLSAYEPTIRDRIASALMPDNPRESPVQARIVEGLTGSRGLGRSTTLGGVVDLVPPVGVLLAGDQASHDARNGDFTGAALSTLGVVGATVPGGGMVANAARSAAPVLEQAAARALAPEAAAVVSHAPALFDDVAETAAKPFSNLIGAVPEEAPAARPFGNMIRQPEPGPVPDVAPAPVAEPVAPVPAAPVATVPDLPPPTTALPEAVPATDAVKIVTPDQSMEITARPQVVELSSLRKAQGEFQPRDRSRAEYVQEARERATRLDPAQLGVSRVSDSGAPIILDDGTIISGNGRTLSIAEVYRDPALKQQADAYRASLGPEAAGMKEPVLVMRAEGLAGEDATRFADLSNRGRIASMSATERAQRDAKALGDTISLYQGGDFEAPQNAEFLRQFMDKVATRTERASISKDGFLTQEGAARMRNAVLASAYDDAPTLARMLESTDDNIRSLTGALTDAAPRFATLRNDIRAGIVMPDMDATPQITEAVKLIADLRSRRVRPADFFAQKDAFGGTDPIAEAWVRAFYNDDLSRALSREKMTAVLNAYADEAIKHRVGGLFPDETTTKDVLNVAQKAKFLEPEAGPVGPGLFDAPAGNGQGVRQGGAEVSRPAIALGSDGPRDGSTGAAGLGTGPEMSQGAKIEAQRKARKAATDSYKAATGKAPPKEWSLTRILAELETTGAK